MAAKRSSLLALVREDGSFPSAIHAAFFALFSVLIFGAVRAQPWYLIWPAALAGLSELVGQAWIE